MQRRSTNFQISAGPGKETEKVDGSLLYAHGRLLMVSYRFANWLAPPTAGNEMEPSDKKRWKSNSMIGGVEFSWSPPNESAETLEFPRPQRIFKIRWESVSVRKPNVFHTYFLGSLNK